MHDVKSRHGAQGRKTMSTRWTHLALHVRSLQSSIAFYERFTSLRVIDRHSDQSSTGMEVIWLSERPAADENAFVLVLQEGTPHAIPNASPQTPLGPISLRIRSAVPRCRGRDCRRGQA